MYDREREINAFNPVEYWSVTAHFDEFDSELFKYKTDDLELHSEEEVNQVLNRLSNKFVVESVEEKEKKSICFRHNKEFKYYCFDCQ